MRPRRIHSAKGAFTLSIDLKIKDTEAWEGSGRFPMVLRQKDDTERMEA